VPIVAAPILRRQILSPGKTQDKRASPAFWLSVKLPLIATQKTAYRVSFETDI
jgi:hypothetical protein